MLIKKEVKLNISNDTATLDEDICLFRNDRNIDICVEVINLKYDFLALKVVKENVVENMGAIYSTVKILKPNGDKYISEKLMLGSDKKVLFSIDEFFMDTMDEVGDYKLQIQLYDESKGKVSLPYFTMKVLNPIFEEEYGLKDGQIDLTNIGLSKISKDNKARVVNELNNRVNYLNSNGLFDWNTGDLITSERMNSIHQNISNLWIKVESINSYTIPYENDNCTNIGEALDLLLYKEPYVNSLTLSIPTELEFGRVIDMLTIYWSYNKNSVVNQYINNVEIPYGERRYNYVERLSTNKTFTLRANDGKKDFSKSISVRYMNKIHWGVSTNTVFNSSLISSLQSYVLSNSKSRSINVNANEGEYIYYAYPTRLGDCIFKVGGFDGGFSKVATIEIVNSYLYSEMYNLYKSTNSGLGSTNVSIS